jgi:tetratricopeptide (TPR) repeat protein
MFMDASMMKDRRQTGRRRALASTGACWEPVAPGILERAVLVLVCIGACALPVLADTTLPASQALKQQEMAVMQALVRDFPENLDIAVLQGNVLYRHGQTEQALSAWQKVLQQDPRRVEIHEELGWFSIEKGQYEQALVHWNKVLEVKAQARGIHSGMARAYMGLNQHEQAAQHLLQEIEIAPNSAFDRFLLGQVYLQSEQYEQAQAAYERAIALDPNMTNAYYGLFNVCSRRGDSAAAKVHMTTFKRLKAEDMRKLKERDAAYDDFMILRRDVAETMLRAGLAYQSTEYAERAGKLLQQAAKLAPNNVDYQLHWGAAALQLGQAEQARRAFGRVIELAPKNARGYTGLAHLYLQTGQQLPEAKALAEQAVLLEPSAFHYYVLSWASDRSGDRPAALAAIRRALEMEPGNARYRRIADAMEKQN